MPSSSESQVKRVIFDCDLGTDDAIALYFLLLAEREGKVKIEMIVCTRGNTSLPNVSKNVVRMLEVSNRTDIPIYLGSHNFLLPRSEDDEFFHGVDGFGDITHESESDLSIIRTDSVFVAMRELIMKSPGEISLICVGPLTNCALLLRIYDDVAENIKDLHIMGGNHHGVGNISSCSEFNFHMDPEAAHITIASAKCPINLLTWECCYNTRTPMSWRMDALATSAGGKTWQLIHCAEVSVYKNFQNDNWMPCDAYLVATLLYPEIILEQRMEHVDVELAGKLTRGQVVIDHIRKKKPNVNIIKEIDYKYFEKLILNAHTQL